MTIFPPLGTSKYTPLEIYYAAQFLINPSSGDALVSRFESDFAKYTSSSHAIAVNSGTSGLHAALLACGIGPGDEVIVPAIAVIMDAYVVLQCGATPVFCDVSQFLQYR